MPAGFVLRAFGCMTWICPKCKRSFAVKAHEHACVSIPLASHFADRPAVLRKAFDKIVKAVSAFGPVSIQPVKGMIFLKKSGTFASVVLRKDHFKLEFFLSELHDEFPVEKTFRYSRLKIVHIVSISGPSEVDSQVVNWLRESYSLAR